MKKAVIKSNSAFVLIGNSPAWITGEDDGKLLSLVQNCNFSINAQRQPTKQLGSQFYAANNIFAAPDVEFSLDYYLTPYLSNELLAGLSVPEQSYSPAVSGVRGKSNNIYLLMDTKNGTDGFDEPRRADPLNANFSGFNSIAFGNCFCNRYSVSFGINQIPTASMGFIASNVRFESLTGNRISVPAINLASGNNSGSGYLNLSNLYQTITGNFIQFDEQLKTEYAPPVASPNTSSFSLEKMDIGGTDLRDSANPILQSFSLDLEIPRTSLYGLGSKYAFDRKMQFPIRGQTQISCLFSGVDTGDLNNLFPYEKKYSFEVAFCDDKKLNTGFYKIDHARLESASYSMSVNNVMQFNASFSFEANEQTGLFMKRATNTGYLWQNIDSLWQNFTVNWSHA